MENELKFESLYDSFVFGVRSPVTREKYLGRLAYFMSYVDITEGNIENRCNIFGEKCKADPRWLLSFLQSTYEAAATCGKWDRRLLERP